MKKTISLATFRRVDRLTEQMIRATMPRTSEACPEALPVHAAPVALVAAAQGTRLVRPLTYTLQEVGRG